MEHHQPFDKQLFDYWRKTDWIGQLLYFFESIDSTNRYLKTHIAAGASPPNGTIALTDYQSAGRGRLGRRWVAPPQTALLVSVVLRPNFSPTWLPMMAGLAVLDALGMEQVALKWPNDVMIRGQDMIWRKTAGILVELQRDETGQAVAVLGMGLNVNIGAEALPEAATPATSLLVETGERHNRERLLAQWVGRLEHWFELAQSGHSPQPAWNTKLITLGQPVTVSGAMSLHGVAETTDEWGRLLVRDAHGALHRCAAGDVSLRRPTSTEHF